MRDSISSQINFNNSVEKAIRGLYHTDVEVLRSKVIDSSNLFYDNLTVFYLKDTKLDDLIRLGIFSWYVPREIGILLRMDIELKAKKLSPEDRSLISQFLDSKERMLVFLQETHLWHTREFFGNLLSKKHSLDRFLNLSPLRRKLKRAQRKRGYNDHGSKTPEHRWLPTSDYSLTELQNLIEEKREIFNETSKFIEGLLF